MSESSVDAWFEGLPEKQRPLLERVRALIFATVPQVTEEEKWSRPCYSTSRGLFCYLQTSKSHATLGFQKGSALADPQKVLQGTGKDMRHVRLKSMDNPDDATLKGLLIQASQLS